MAAIKAIPTTDPMTIFVVNDIDEAVVVLIYEQNLNYHLTQTKIKSYAASVTEGIVCKLILTLAWFAALAGFAVASLRVFNAF